ncbi:indole-3-glycerol phosphate synthase TrpC [Saccharicrinis sp. FJH54]|uniref:indole-3-glycerol phosphate synthase TrpC n=1 Tax=Saccharicrinis sp. FJH54 TaxID=3344665 RepID=UPI0035D4F815
MNILDKIVANKKVEVAEKKVMISEKQLKNSISPKPVPSLKAFLENPDKSGIICEYKRMSPSKGLINGTAKVQDVTRNYEQAGASAISVLTDKAFFGGTAQDLTDARDVTTIPILRKDFIIDPFQILEARAIGASAILLIAAILEKDEIKSLAQYAYSLGLEVLFEVHNTEELEKYDPIIEIVGVNNRNLKTFEVNIETSVEVGKFIPENCVKVAESGISDIRNIQYLKQFGFEGFLIGENFMKTNDPGQACIDFIKCIKDTGIRTQSR